MKHELTENEIAKADFIREHLTILGEDIKKAAAGDVKKDIALTYLVNEIGRLKDELDEVFERLSDLDSEVDRRTWEEWNEGK